MKDRAPASQNQLRRDPRNGRIRYINLWLIEFRGRTATLSPAAVGAYLRLLTEYALRQEPLADDAKALCRISGIARRDWAAIRDELLDVFELVDGVLVDDYVEKRIEEFRAASKRGRSNIAKRYGVIDGLKDAQS